MERQLGLGAAGQRIRQAGRGRSSAAAVSVGFRLQAPLRPRLSLWERPFRGARREGVLAFSLPCLAPAWPGPSHRPASAAGPGHGQHVRRGGRSVRECFFGAGALRPFPPACRPAALPLVSPLSCPRVCRPASRPSASVVSTFAAGFSRPSARRLRFDRANPPAGWRHDGLHTSDRHRIGHQLVAEDFLQFLLDDPPCPARRC